MTVRPSLKHLSRSEGKAVPIGRIGFSFKTGASVGSGSAVAEMTFPAGATQALHCHPSEETLYVVDGEVEMLGDSGERRLTGPGCVLHVPSGAVHGFVNVGATDARLLVVTTLAQESFFEDLSATMARRPGDPQAVAEVKARHGIESVEAAPAGAR